MSSNNSTEERDVYNALKDFVNKDHKEVSGHDLILLLKRIRENFPSIDSVHVFEHAFWDEVGLKLWDTVSKGNVDSAKLIAPWRIIFEMLKSKEPSTSAPTAPPLQVCALNSTKPPDTPAPLDTGQTDSDLEPDLYPDDYEDPYNVWAAIKEEALKAGDMDIVHLIDIPPKPRYKPAKNKGLFANICEAHVLTPYDLRSLTALLLNNSQQLLWESRWRAGVEKLLITYATEENQELRAVTAEQLMGLGEFSYPARQAREIPRPALTANMHIAQRALLQVPEAGKPDKAFANIVQGAKEQWQKIEQELWKSVQKGLKEAQTLAGTCRVVQLAEKIACSELCTELPQQRETAVEAVEKGNSAAFFHHTPAASHSLADNGEAASLLFDLKQQYQFHSFWLQCVLEICYFDGLLMVAFYQVCLMHN